MRNVARYLPLALFAVVLLWLAWPTAAWYWKTDQEKIEHAVRAMAEGARQRHAGMVMEWVSEKYEGDRFHNNRDELYDSVRRFMFMFKEIEIQIQQLTIEIDPDDPTKASVQFDAPILVSRTKGQKPTQPFVNRHRGTNLFVLTFRKEGNTWRVIRTDSEKYKDAS